VAKKWEDAKRPYGFVQVLISELLVVSLIGRSFEKGRALLLLHGTFKYGRLRRLGTVYAEWNGFLGLAPSITGNRALAFNHPTLP
jgi:hypothetical protein